MTAARFDPTIEWLRGALVDLRTEAATLSLPLDLAGRDDAYREAARLVGHIDGFLLPRLGRTGAPVLAVVGGSTGAGKSTLVNSIVQAPVSPAGVLRPTTRAPVVVCHPSDAGFFGEHGLPAVLRPHPTRRSTQTRIVASPGVETARVLVAPAMVPGLAVLDAPDIDSLVAANRELAMHLFDAADLWVFVTTAARYADAAPWRALAIARDRGASLVVLLNRVPPKAMDELAGHFGDLLDRHGLPDVPYFVMPETTLTGSGMLPDGVVGPIRDWLDGIARDPDAAASVRRRTLDGALRALDRSARTLAGAAQAQATAVYQLRDRVDLAHRGAAADIRRALREGTLLRGEVLARWRGVAQTDTIALTTALAESITALVVSAAGDAADETAGAWYEHPAGREMLTPELTEVDPYLRKLAPPVVANWLRRVERAAGRYRELPMDRAGAVVAVRAIAGPESAELSGHEYRKALIATAEAAEEYRDELGTDLGELLRRQADRYHNLLDDLSVSTTAADGLRLAAHRVNQAERVDAA